MSLSEARPAKRARQACLTCRYVTDLDLEKRVVNFDKSNYSRKKTRCPGEKPVCSFCMRLGQTCTYGGVEVEERVPDSKSRLTKRVSELESELKRLADYVKHTSTEPNRSQSLPTVQEPNASPSFGPHEISRDASLE
ncbi:hypothetical protein N7539_000876 [Penicillium diatomitis]|uniref:Zn(2)-C6 fungal-type domain-containing protein n=1 Tax=Penicillium diatomitis TaxID=2819901 RepID=A0A9X0C329_9EURO|nr:uncharacterized protein N7539_000876 [Penicillium diatomitis]KAJ5495760.1 hypothetical protein N7539_000876 [Penicillium diatomitis]